MLDQILWTAIITPFNYDSSIDYESLKTCVLLQEKAGNGIVILGSTGESTSLTQDEKISILSFISRLNLKVPIICGVPSHNLFSAIGWIKICRDYNIDGFLIPTPTYTKPGEIGQMKWFECLLHVSHLPVMLYNIPSRTGVSLYPFVVRELKDHELFIAIKDSSGSLCFIDKCQKLASNILIYSGDDEMMQEMAFRGAKGLISVFSNIFVEEMKYYVSSCLVKDFADFDLWRSIFYLLKQTVNPISIKALLYDVGLIKSDFVRLPLSQEDNLFREVLLKKYKEIKKAVNFSLY